MSGCDDLKVLLAPLGLYDLSAGTRNEAELFALGAALDGVDAALTAAEREALVPTAVGEGLALREALLPWRPAAETLAERRAAIRALLCIDGDSLTLAAVNRAIQGCGIRAQVRETLDYYLNNARVIREGLTAAGLTVSGGVDSPYVWARTPAGMPSWDFFDRLLRRANVVTTPGAGFGPSGEGYIRLTGFGEATATQEAVRRIKSAL